MKTLKTLAFIVVVLLIGAGAWYFLGTVNTFSTPSEQNGNNIAGGDKDEHGCIGSAGYAWCQASQKCLRVFEEFCPDGVLDLVSNINENTGENFEYAGEKIFIWNISQDNQFASTSINGVQYKIDGIKRADYQKIEDYMRANYEENLGNIADGVVGGERGYISGYMACTLNFIHTEMINTPGQPSVPANDILNVTLSCGFFNKNQIPQIMVGQKIKEVLANKYGKTITETNVKVNKYNGTYAQGSVVFSQDGQGEGGMFLAILNNGSWQVVFEGNGAADCQTLKTTYQFPQDFLQGFCD